MNTGFPRLNQLVIYLILGLLFIIMIAVGFFGYIVVNRDSIVYPFSEEVLTVGKCGQTFYKQPASSIRVERYRCYVTEDSQGEVHTWYIRNGYALRNDGFVQERVSLLGRRYYDIERVYTYKKDGKTVIRVYDDTIIRFR
ncbi:MAG: hypothetical protein AAF633_03290 [Chloroflexota bacterium]